MKSHHILEHRNTKSMKGSSRTESSPALRATRYFENKYVKMYKFTNMTKTQSFPDKLNIHLPSARFEYCRKPNTEECIKRNTQPPSKVRVPCKQASNYIIQNCQCLHTYTHKRPKCNSSFKHFLPFEKPAFK